MLCFVLINSLLFEPVYVFGSCFTTLTVILVSIFFLFFFFYSDLLHAAQQGKGSDSAFGSARFWLWLLLCLALALPPALLGSGFSSAWLWLCLALAPALLGSGSGVLKALAKGSQY